MKDVTNKYKNMIEAIIILCLIISVFISLFIFFRDMFRSISNSLNYEIHYIDFDNNKGIADFCDNDMSCVVDGKRLAVKEFYKIYK